MILIALDIIVRSLKSIRASLPECGGQDVPLNLMPWIRESWAIKSPMVWKGRGRKAPPYRDYTSVKLLCYKESGIIKGIMSLLLRL